MIYVTQRIDEDDSSSAISSRVEMSVCVSPLNHLK